MMMIGCVLAVAGAMGMVVSTQAKDDGQAIALSQDIPGKNNIGGRGAEFAPELYSRLVKAGGEAHLVTFKWRREFEKTEQARLSTVVVYRDAEGRYWGMDMYTVKPVWVPGKEPQKWIDRMYPNLISSVVTARTDAKLAGQYADLSRVAGATTTAPAPAPTQPAPAAPSARADDATASVGVAQ